MAAARQSASGPGTSTGTTKGFHWDEVIVYAPHSKWEDSPAPLFWDGPVYRSISGLAKALGEVSRPKPPDKGPGVPHGND